VGGSTVRRGNAVSAVPPPARSRRALLTAVVLAAAAGLVVTLWRPTAPPLLGTPTELSAFHPDLLARVAAYRGSQRLMALLALLLSVAVPVLALVVPATRWRLVALARRGRPAIGAALAVVAVVVAIDVVTLPLDVWIGWFHEREWGFAAGSLRLWLRDRLVGLVLRVLIAVVAAVAVRALAARAADTWQHWLVLLATVAVGVLVLLQPLVVQPLFLSTEPLSPGPVREAVAEVLAAAGEFELGIDVGDASRRTTRVNAFVTGLGPSRRVVLYDTLLELPPDQVAYVVAHELAHREHRDLPRGILLTATAAVPVVWVLRRLWEHPRVEALRSSAGGQARLLPMAALVVLVLATWVGTPLANAVSRRAEAAADHRALELTGEPAVQIAVNRVFVERDLADPTPPAWVTALWGTHPPTGARIQAAVDHAVRYGLPLPALDEVQGR